MSRLSLTLALVILISAASFAADDPVTSTRMELYPNFETLSVYLHYSGDANANSSVAMEYRKAGGEWIEGHPLTRIYESQWAGSIFWLDPAAVYEVRVKLSDPDGVSEETISATATTRDDRWPVGTGRTIHVAPGATGDPENRPAWAVNDSESST